jgi:glycosyltransferase involved in cell wall biosynthesis
VAILLATYNPGFHIEEQLASIASQTYTDFKIYWGDDGSDEKQVLNIRKLLEPFAFEEYHFNRIGATQNFFELLKETEEEYIAFCDQDDVWMPEKLEKQKRALEDFQSIPSLSHSPVQILRDGQLTSVIDLCQDHSITQLTGENCCRGCTMMINQAAKIKILQVNSKFATWHDWLAISVVSSIGKIHKVEQPLVQYRLHSKNSIGVPNYSRRILSYLQREKGVLLSQFESIHSVLRPELEHDVLEEYSRFFDLFKGNLLKRAFNLLFDEQRRKSNILDSIRKIVWSFKTP